MGYSEKMNDKRSLPLRQEYLDSIEALVKQREEEFAANEAELAEHIFADQEGARSAFKNMLGWPLNTDQKLIGEPEKELLFTDEDYNVYRMRFEILPGVKLGGIFYQLKTAEPRPLVIAQHGANGTCEVVAGLLGQTWNYNFMAERVMRKKVHLFAPQLLGWWPGEQGPMFNRQELDARLKKVGSCLNAIEVFGIGKILDYFEAKPYVSAFGMLGLSFGGFYTLYTTACDTRIKSAIACSSFSGRRKFSAPDNVWLNSAYTFSDAEIACLVYPRRICFEMGRNDELIDYNRSVDEFERLKKLCGERGSDWTELVLFDGIHEFCKDDSAIDRFIAELEK